MRVTVRYDVLRDFGAKEPETRREFNLRFGQDEGPEAEIPSAVSHVWDWFWTLDSRRQRTESGAQPLTFSEIDAWVRLMGEIPTPEEVRMILAMDSEYTRSNADENNQQTERIKSRAPQPKRR